VTDENDTSLSLLGFQTQIREIRDQLRDCARQVEALQAKESTGELISNLRAQIEIEREAGRISRDKAIHQHREARRLQTHVDRLYAALRGLATGNPNVTRYLHDEHGIDVDESPNPSTDGEIGGMEG